MNVVQEINDFTAKIRNRYSELHKKNSEYDLSEQDILHYIEFEKYDAVAGSRILKKLKEIRIERRKIKDEFESLQSVMSKLTNSGLLKHKRPNKKYTYRTVTLESLFGGESI